MHCAKYFSINDAILSLIQRGFKIQARIGRAFLPQPVDDEGACMRNDSMQDFCVNQPRNMRAADKEQEFAADGNQEGSYASSSREAPFKSAATSETAALIRLTSF